MCFKTSDIGMYKKKKRVVGDSNFVNKNICGNET